MPVETDLERQLRVALHGHVAPDGLPDQVLLDSLAGGRSSLRSRRRLAITGAVVAVVVVAGLAVAAVQRDDGTPQPAVPPPSPSPSPSNTEPLTTTAGIWAASLPQGEPASVPYVVGTTVIEPDGRRIRVAGTSAGVIGNTVAGLVLLVETDKGGVPFSSRYVLARATGEVEDLPVSTLTADGAQEAVVSPDGRQFTSGGDILDMTDGSVVGQVPDEAEVLGAWTTAGIVYWVHDGSIFLWSEAAGARPLDGYPGTFESGSDVGTRQCHVVRLTESGEVSPVSDVCIHRLWSVSRSGRWALTEDLHLVDVSTGASRNLSVRPVSNLYTHRKVWWDGDDSLLIPAGDWLVRCSTAEATCERVTGPEKGLALP